MYEYILTAYDSRGVKTHVAHAGETSVILVTRAVRELCHAIARGEQPGVRVTLDLALPVDTNKR